MSFVAELKRRKVVKVGVAYAAVGNTDDALRVLREVADSELPRGVADDGP